MKFFQNVERKVADSFSNKYANNKSDSIEVAIEIYQNNP